MFGRILPCNLEKHACGTLYSILVGFKAKDLPFYVLYRWIFSSVAAVDASHCQESIPRTSPAINTGSISPYSIGNQPLRYFIHFKTAAGLYFLVKTLVLIKASLWTREQRAGSLTASKTVPYSYLR